MNPKNIQNRKFTDPLCTIFFVAVAGFALVQVLLVSKDTKEFKLLNLYDQFGNICGKDEAAGFDYLYLKPNLNPKNAFKKRFCVKECPSEKGEKLKCMEGPQYKDCTQIVVKETLEVLDKLCVETQGKSFFIF